VCSFLTVTRPSFTSSKIILLCIFGRVRKIMKSDHQLRHVCLSVRPPAWNSAPTGRIFIKFEICAFFENLSRKFKVSLKCYKNNGYSTWRRFHTNDIISLNFS
jgi:hypothetical protein